MECPPIVQGGRVTGEVGWLGRGHPWVYTTAGGGHLEGSVGLVGGEGEVGGEGGDPLAVVGVRPRDPVGRPLQKIRPPRRVFVGAAPR